MGKHIIIKPVISEKSENLSDKVNQYTFVVDKNANKIQIKQEVEQLYGVQVERVNTMIMPGKAKSRSTRAGMVKGVRPAYKKAIVTVAEGDMIDLYGEI
jgi:large subunit ribosomal protein L23